MTRARKAPASRALAAVPRLVADRFAPGANVIVTEGLSSGMRGVVRERDALTFGGEPMYRVDLGGLLGVRVIRETYLT